MDCQGIVPKNAHTACANRFIRDGEKVEFGSITFEAIAIPGHSDSHIAYLVNGERVLTGDALLIRDVVIQIFKVGTQELCLTL